MRKILAVLLLVLAVAAFAVPAQAVTYTENHCVRNLDARVQTLNGIQYVIPANAKGTLVALPLTTGYFAIRWDNVYMYAGSYRDDFKGLVFITGYTQFRDCDAQGN
jgi:hypothetical protein